MSITTSMASTVTPQPADAQQPSAQTSVAITVRVQPVLAIRGIAVAPPRAAAPRSRERAEVASVVDVESNLPYRVAVRLAPAARTGAGRVFVRAVSGAFEPLGPDASLVVAAGRAPGRRAHEVHCRVESTPAEVPDAGRCVLVYELSAEHHDSLLRTTAIQAAPATPATPAAAGSSAGR